MKPILVHCHIYYAEMWPELKRCLQNITVDYDLYVTMVEMNNKLREDIFIFKPDVYLDIVPNKGFDIAPFIDVLNKVDLSKYDYIVKLHTKRDMSGGTLVAGWNLSGNRWREYLLRFLKDQKTFQSYLMAFEQDQNLGMVSDFHNICCTIKPNPEAADKSLELMKLLNLQVKSYAYVMGTMFMARASLFEPIKKLHLDFDPSERGIYILPYGMEILFGLIVSAQGYKVQDPIHCRACQLFAKFCESVRNFIWRRKECSNGKIVIKFCKIPIYKSKRGVA